MNMNIDCILCNSKAINKIENIRVSYLAYLYEQMFSESVLKEFNDIEEISFYSCNNCGLKFFYPFISGSQEFYGKLQKFDWYYLKEKDEYELASQFIKETDDVLEVGCGKGEFFKKIKAKNYVGLEFSQKAKMMADINGINVINESIKDHSEKYKQYYDVVCSFQVLEHITELNEFLKNSISCLKPGGFFIVSVPSADSFISLGINNILNMPPHHITWWSDMALHSISKLFGLELLRLEHELLSDMHVSWAVRIIALNAIRSFMKDKNNLIDMTLKFKLEKKIAAIASKFLSKTYNNVFVRPRGHSVTAIFRKVSF